MAVALLLPTIVIADPAMTFESVNTYLLTQHDTSLVDAGIMAVLVITILVIVLSLTGVTTCYEDFNDLGVSLGVFAGPAMVALIATYLVLPYEKAFWLCVLPGAICLIVTTINAFKSNKIIFVPFVLVAKLTLSFLWLFYLWAAASGETRKARNVGILIWGIVSVVLLAVVKDKEGIYRVTRGGRVVKNT